MKIWVVSMECAGIIEAGGVKDVTFSLCQTFAKYGNEVTLFIPVFATNSYDKLKNLKEKIFSAQISLCNQTHTVFYSTACLSVCRGVKVVLVHHQAFSEKHAVYVYTEQEQEENPEHVRGTGHKDTHFLDAVLSKAASEYISLIPKDSAPDVVHCQDASTAIAPCYMSQKKDFYQKTKYFVTIHNAGPAYHHEFCNIDEAAYYTELPKDLLQEAQNGCRVEPFLLAAKNAKLTAVSTFYAEEIVNPQNNDSTDGLASIFASRNIKIYGITNGIDCDIYSPEDTKKSLLPYDFSPQKTSLLGKYKNRDFFLDICAKDSKNASPNFLDGIKRFGFLLPDSDNSKIYFVYHGRIVGQKGIPLLVEVMNKILPENSDFRFIIMGQGESAIENSLQDCVNRFEGRVIYLKGYNKALSRLCVAAADFSILPSHFEPCCLEDFISQIYGTIPIAHATGGLKKIIDGETGFLYAENTTSCLENAIFRAAKLKQDTSLLNKMIQWAATYVKDVYSWNVIVKEKYLPLFEESVC